VALASRTHPAFEASPSVPGEVLAHAAPPGGASWRVVLRRMARNRAAVLAAGVLFLIVASCLAAPLYARYVAGVGPTRNNLTGRFERGGKRLYVVTPPPDSRPVGPGFSRRYLLGADRNGRDVMVRLLYGGRNSLLIGLASTLLTVLIAVGLGLASGYFRGRVDLVIGSLFDLLWSLPALLLAIALGAAVAIDGLRVGPVHVESDSLWLPILVIGVVFVPYLGRPVRGQVLALRERSFVEAARAEGLGPAHIMVREILPNLVSTIAVFATLIVANNILTEAALSYLGAGVQPPRPSWGNMIADGTQLIESAPVLTIVPGVAITLTVLCLNVLSDGLRDALDPRSRRRAA
jgi:peptide/nickel transport system permease protein